MSVVSDEKQPLPAYKATLYQLQQEAPRPIAIICDRIVEDCPAQYGREYHGHITRQDTDNLLGTQDGSFLIRRSNRADDAFTLAIRFDGATKNYKLFYEEGMHYVGETRFDAVYDLVADGLIHFYVESRGAAVLATLASNANYEYSPYYHTRYYTIQSKASLRRKATSSQKKAPRRTRILRQMSSDGLDGSLQQQAQQNSLASRRRSEDIANIASSSGGRDVTSVVGLPSLPPLVTEAPAPSVPAPSSSGSSTTKTAPNTPSLPGPGVVSLRSGGGGGSSGGSGAGTPTPAEQQSSSSPSPDVSLYVKPHQFKLYNFKGPHWCDYCSHFMWGLLAQGVKCADCGFNAHKRCSEKVPADCLPDMKYLKRMFGVDLTTLVKAQNRNLPLVLEQCIAEVERRGLQLEGLYRLAGFHDDVEAIKLAFDKDPDTVDISYSRCEDVSTLTSVVKAYLRQLPIPLITYDTYNIFLSAVQDDYRTSEKKRRGDLIHALNRLPPAHYQTLKFIMAHFHRVVENQRVNMMSPENLAIVLAPSIIRSPDSDPLSSLAHAKAERSVVEYLVSDYPYLFEECSYTGCNTPYITSTTNSTSNRSSHIPATTVATHLR